MRLDISYFTGFRVIANLNDEIVRDVLEENIERLESQFFTNVFGYEFQKLMLADPTNPIYESVLDGVEFTNSNNRLVKWEGINESLANYVYYFHYAEQMPMTGGANFVTPLVENSAVADPTPRLLYAYNKIYPALKILEEYLTINLEIYPTLDFTIIETKNIYGF